MYVCMYVCVHIFMNVYIKACMYGGAGQCITMAPAIYRPSLGDEEAVTMSS